MSKPFSQNAAAGAISDSDIISLLQSSGATASGVDNFNASMSELKTFLAQAFMLSDNNLSELTNIPDARLNLGLGSAAQKEVGTSAGQLPAIESVNSMVTKSSARFVQESSFTSGVYSLNSVTGAAIESAHLTGQPIIAHFLSANSASASATVDGGSQKQLVTVTGATLPTGYIRAGVPTLIWYDGTSLVVDRTPERGSNSGGSYVRFADGRQDCFIQGFNGIANDVTWTYPSSFKAGTSPVVNSTVINSANNRVITLSDPTENSVAFRRAGLSGTGVTDAVCLHAHGLWY